MAIRYSTLECVNRPYHRVGTDGSIWSRYALGGHGKIGDKWRKMKPTSDGFRMVVNLKGKTFNVNRLVLLAFVGPCPEGMEGCHGDGNHRNNDLSNLRWDTHVNNEKDKKRHGTSNVGTRNGSAKLTEEQVREIRCLYATGAYSLTQLARKFGMFFTTLHPLIHRRTWKHVV